MINTVAEWSDDILLPLIVPFQNTNREWNMCIVPRVSSGQDVAALAVCPMLDLHWCVSSPDSKFDLGLDQRWILIACVFRLPHRMGD